jgi:cellulose synthase (UDP-forming)
MIKPEAQKNSFLKNRAPQATLLFAGIMAILYLYAMTFLFPRGNIYLFSFLIATQMFYAWQALTFIYTVWNPGQRVFKKAGIEKLKDNGVDVFITVAGEPVDVVEDTARAALQMEYPNFQIYILNDGYVAKKENWKEIEEMAERLGIGCITRTIPGGAKAGNINHGLSKTKNPFFVIFDADHIPHKDFLREMMPYFADPKMGFVQSPQYYKNYDVNYVTAGAWEQQQMFFGPICKGKNRLNAVTMCGTNMVIRREAILEVGGMCDTNIAEDFVTGLFVHERGWKSAYVPKVLAEGLAPEDFLSYYKQQFRWARGSLEVLFGFNPLFRRGLTWAQKIQYLSSASYYLSGIVVIINAFIPLMYLYFGLVPYTTSTMGLALVFIPYIITTIYSLQRSSNWSYTFRALSFSKKRVPSRLHQRNKYRAISLIW